MKRYFQLLFFLLPAVIAGAQGVDVTLPSGPIRGKQVGSLRVFHNLPYAQAGRGEKPKAVTPWAAVRDATQRGPECPQDTAQGKYNFFGRPGTMRFSEQCQVLSVWAPEGATQRPVVVFIHGGSYLNGSGEQPMYDLSKLASENDIIAVSISYRLGAFGYLYRPSDDSWNLGLQDQLAALKWIRRNIGLFGGNKDQVTVIGQSAGASSVQYLIAAADTELFQQAVILSAPGGDLSRSKAEKITKAFYKELGQDYLTAPVEAILKAQGKMRVKGKTLLPFAPVGVEKAAATIRCGLKRCIITTQKDDAMPFVVMALSHEKRGKGNFVDRQAGKLMTERAFAKPAQAYLGYLRGKGVEAVYQELDWEPQGSVVGAGHCAELPLLCGAWHCWQGAMIMGTETEASVALRGQKWRKALADFASGKAASFNF